MLVAVAVDAAGFDIVQPASRKQDFLLLALHFRIKDAAQIGQRPADDLVASEPDGTLKSRIDFQKGTVAHPIDHYGKGCRIEHGGEACFRAAEAFRHAVETGAQFSQFILAPFLSTNASVAQLQGV